ncbi:MAG: aminotransferase class I/II-fold pyridoxal phosphate-dependent enzyme [Candidatus Aegiribacteria sp.]|nr:aminotransferase class I/II-fold pyridoxal phosphate-dependent enzyme [Candidatus Aegiribacteria sp.]
MPPISEIMSRISDLSSSGRRIYSMAQAAPWYSPPSSVLDNFAAELKEPFIHRYSPDPGFPWARKAVTEDFRVRRGIDLDPASEIHLTCGASQAFLSALLATTNPGGNVAVIEPYYFDHVFAVKFSDLGLCSIPMIEDNGGWTVPLDELNRWLPEVAALVVVNPGNPTGKVIPDSVMMRIVEMTAESGTFLIIDETYERFVFTGDNWHPWKDERQRHVLTLGSFSKSLGIPGWRLGYLFGSADLMEQAIKVQDSVVICPPSPSQYLLEKVLKEEEWIKEMSAGVSKRLEFCRSALTGSSSLFWREAGGAFFTLAAYEGSMKAQDAAMYLLDEYGIGTIPGSAFGESGEGHLRISFGCLSDEELEPAMKLLSEVSLPC